MKKKKYYPAVLTVAGSDSGGGAGIQADLKTFASYGVFGCTAITAATAQNFDGVRRIDSLPPESVGEQIKAVTAKFAISAVKTGMLFDSPIVLAVSKALCNIKAPIVVDPVMVSTSGAVLLKPNAIKLVKNELLPLAEWVTPNIHEAEVLSGRNIQSFSEMLEASSEISDKWRCGCVLKGGHFPASQGMKKDAISYRGRRYWLYSPEIKVRTLHGAGCTFSAALVSALALGLSWDKALLSAKAFIYGSLAEMISVGRNISSLNPPRHSYSKKVSLKEV